MIYQASFDAAGERVITASADGTARVYWVGEDRPPLVLADHTRPVERAVFSPDGEHALTASLDGTARLWTLTGAVSSRVLQHTEGVESVEGIFARQFFDPPPEGYVHDYPIPRDWDGETYDPRSPDAKRPFCVWRGDHCSFDVWREGALKGKNVRPNWGFERTASGGFDDVEGWAAVFDPGPARGGLMAEAPALLRFANEFHMSGSSASPENYNGYPRGGDWRWSGGHIGSLPGARAAAFQIRGGTRVRELPPMVAGVLTDEFTARDTVIYELPDGVDFVAMVNQRGDSRCELQLGDVCDREYNALHDFLHYALSQVDWEAVEAMIAAESTTAVGMAIDRGGRTHVWFADDRRRSWLGRPDQDPGAPDEVDEVAAPGAPDGYRLPSTRIGQDVLGVAMNDADVVYAWYDAGRVSAGKPGDLAAIHGPVPFTIPEGFRREAIAAIAIADDGVVYTWFEDGRWLAGTATELGATAEGSFQTAVPGGVGAIQAIAFDRSTGRVWTRYRDQSVSEGTVEDLSAFAVHG